MNRFQKILTFLASPFTLGVIITLAVCFTAIKFYDYRSGTVESSNTLFRVLTWIEQKTNDFRLIDRGIREPTDRVAILAIDDRSIEELGRWPWSRDRIAAIIEKMQEYGASVTGFDIVFSEYDKNQTMKVLEDLKNSQLNSPQSIQIINDKISQADTDKVLVATVKKYATNLVLGTYFDPAFLKFQPYQEVCVARAYKKTRAAKYWEKEPPIIVVDENDYELSQAFSGLLDELLNTISQKRTEEVLERFHVDDPAKLQFNQAQILETEVFDAQLHYCESWLKPNSDPYINIFEEAWPIIAEAENGLDPNFQKGVAEFKRKFLYNPIKSVGRWWISFPELADVTSTSGFFLADLDSDGTIRKSPLIVRTANRLSPSLALQTYLVDQKRQAQIFIRQNPKVPEEKIVSDFAIADSEEGNVLFHIPTDSSGRLNINYAGPSRLFPYFSVADLFSENPKAMIEKRVYDKQAKRYIVKKEEVDKAQFIKNKIFVIGATATGIYDLRVTPLEENCPGVETHANVIDNLLRQDFLRTHPEEEMIILILTLVLGILLSLTLAKLGAVYGLIVTATALGSIYLVDKYYFFKNGYVMTTFFPILLTIFIYVFMTFYKYFTEERKKRELKGTFAKYVSPAIVDEILSDPTKIELGGRKERLTVLFSDIRGFTTISEKLDPRSLSDLLNSYLTPMTRLVFEHKGTLDKYMGDAVMAFWGAPIHFPDHAKCACRCALSMLEKLKELKTEYQQKGLPTIDIGIGLNTGEMSVGNMGSDIVRSYTVMGDSVNLGSRLEGINKQYGTRIIISEFTYGEVKDSFVAREVDWVRVKGKVLPVKIYELVAEGQTSSENVEMIKWFNEGFELYHQRNFSGAVEKFTQALNVNPADTCSKLYLERCQNYIEEPPPENWDGVFTMKTK